MPSMQSIYSFYILWQSNHLFRYGKFYSWKLLVNVMCNVQGNKCNVKCWNTLGCLDQYMAPNSQNTRGECRQQMEVNTLHPLKCRWVPPPLKMCYQALMINTWHQIINILEVSAPTPTHGSKYPPTKCWWMPPRLNKSNVTPLFCIASNICEILLYNRHLVVINYELIYIAWAAHH